ncbi:MAG TPA: phosphoenolpyruvate--protein phosphotransferase [Pyrinomonadaceae bacterium]|nr:phosphoenolpyruvate--protein phosphotransferase [Pyrinomonadaceae bacterium]
MSENNASDSSQRIRLTGRVVSRGKAFGPVYVLPKSDLITDFRDLNEHQIALELENFDRAVFQVTDRLKDATDKYSSSVADNTLDIISAQAAIVADPSFCGKVRDRIRNDAFGAQLAIRIVTDEYRDQLLSLEDEHLREKAADLQDVCEQLLSFLYEKPAAFELPRGSVIVCSEIWPTTVLSIAASKPAAIVTEAGGWTSHAFILARELGIPAISGVKNVIQRLANGDNVRVDAVNGHIEFIDFPDETVISTIPPVSLENKPSIGLASRVKLSDGTELFLLANADSADKCREALDSGVSEIGLVRSEYLFEMIESLPNETLQTDTYREIAEAANGRSVAIRTFDVSIGRLVAGKTQRERNPALGMRSIRLTLRYERQFRSQLRALIRANSRGNLSIVVPMVSGAADVRRVRSLVKSEFEKISSSESNAIVPKIGAMIELPSAVITIDQILEEVDFVCLGTNDLVQYVLGVDRDNETVADWYQTLHPAILRSIKSVIDSAAAMNKPATVCGEAAGSPFYLPLLVGLGVRRFSMNPSSIASMIEHARKLSLSDCSRLTESMLLSTSASQNERTLANFCAKLWPGLGVERVNFPPASTSNF